MHRHAQKSLRLQETRICFSVYPAGFSHAVAYDQLWSNVLPDITKGHAGIRTHGIASTRPAF